MYIGQCTLYILLIHTIENAISINHWLLFLADLYPFMKGYNSIMYVVCLG
jgi:hypothetical protein